MSSTSDFTPFEIELMRKLYYTHCAKGLVPYFPGRSQAQIAARAAYEGLKCDPEVANSFKRNQEPLDHIVRAQTPFVAYMLGFLWADGYIGRKTFYIRLKIVDNDFRDISKAWLKTAKSWRYAVKHDGNPNHQPQALVELNHKGVYDMLVKNDYLVKSGTSADKILAHIPENLHHYWWRGYFDGDGGFTSHKKTYRVTLSSVYNQDWSFLERLADKIGLIYSMSIRSTGSSRNSTIRIENEANIRRFMNYIYQGEIFGLKRKRDAYEAFKTYKASARPGKTSVYRGVSWISDKCRWMMQIYKGKHHRAYHDTELEAAKHYDDMAKKLFGQKAVLNFP